MAEPKRAATGESSPIKASKPRAAKKPAARKVPRAEAAKAVAEVKDPDNPRVGSFRGVPLTLPAVLPASFAFDCMEIGESDASTMTDIRSIIVGLVGRDQWKLVRDKIAADGDPIDAVDPILEELIDSVTSPYGIDLGESSASATP